MHLDKVISENNGEGGRGIFKHLCVYSTCKSKPDVANSKREIKQVVKKHDLCREVPFLGECAVT